MSSSKPYISILDQYINHYFEDVEGIKKAVLETQKTTPQLYVVQGCPMQNHVFMQFMSNVVDYSNLFQWVHPTWDLNIGAPCRFMVITENHLLPIISENVSGPVWAYTDRPIPEHPKYKVFTLKPTATSVCIHTDDYYNELYEFLNID